MYNYYIDERSYVDCGIQRLSDNISDLVCVYTEYADKSKEHFFKSDSLWTIPIEKNKTLNDCLFLPLMRRFKGADIRTLSQLQTDNSISSLVDLKSKFNLDINASWGISFVPKCEDNLTNQVEYEHFKKAKAVERISTDNFMELEKFVFKKLVFCPDVYSQILILDKNTFGIILPDLIKLDNYNTQWTSGHCAAAVINSTVGLNISGESSSVNSDPKLRSQRYFKLPDGRLEYFEMHIKKSSGLRIHIFADDTQKQVYVGYIGKHLSTAKY